MLREEGFNNKIDINKIGIYAFGIALWESSCTRHVLSYIIRTQLPTKLNSLFGTKLNTWQLPWYVLDLKGIVLAIAHRHERPPMLTNMAPQTQQLSCAPA